MENISRNDSVKVAFLNANRSLETFRRSKGFETDSVIDRFPQLLLAAKVTLRRLDADMPQQELNLLQLAA